MRIYREMQNNTYTYSILPYFINSYPPWVEPRLDVPEGIALLPSESRMNCADLAAEKATWCCWLLCCLGWLPHHAVHRSPAWPCPTFKEVPVPNLSMWGTAGDQSNL